MIEIHWYSTRLHPFVVYRIWKGFAVKRVIHLNPASPMGICIAIAGREHDLDSANV